MVFRGSLFGFALRAGLFRQACQVHCSRSIRPFHAFSQIHQSSNSSAGVQAHLEPLSKANLKFGSARVLENASLPYAVCFRSYIHSGKQVEVDAGRKQGSMEYVSELMQANGDGVTGRSTGQFPGLRQVTPNSGTGLPMDQFSGLRGPSGVTGRTMDQFSGLRQGSLNGENGRPMDSVPGLFQGTGNFIAARRQMLQQQPLMETNADIVHIKLMRNNAFVTVTDSKGNKKKGTSMGRVAGKGAKLTRYASEAAAESIGREVRQMKTKSVVVKVNGFTFFRKKRDAILSFKDGYTNQRGDMNPIVYIEDTTRKPHNGCRRRKQRRI